MPTNCKLTATFQTTSLLPEDYIVNTWHFRWMSGIPVGDFNNPLDMVDDFYFAIAPGNSVTLSSRMPSIVFTGTCWLRLYNMSDPEPRAPIAERTKTSFPRSSADALPRECALVMSFQAENQAGIPQRRRRNRVYLGPFAEQDNDSAGRPSISLRGIIARAGKQLVNASDTSAFWKWNINSSYSSGDYVPITNGWIDNQWDTQRRRGPKSTERSVFTSALPS